MTSRSLSHLRWTILRRSKLKKGKRWRKRIRLSKKSRNSKTSFKVWMSLTLKSWSKKVGRAEMLSKTSAILPKVRHLVFSYRQDAYRPDILSEGTQHKTWPVKTLPINFSSKATHFFSSHWAYFLQIYRPEIEAKRIIHALVPCQKTRGRKACCPARSELSSVNKMIRIFTSEKDIEDVLPRSSPQSNIIIMNDVIVKLWDDHHDY